VAPELQPDGSVRVRSRERFQHEHFDGPVGVDVVIAHEADHLASRELAGFRPHARALVFPGRDGKPWTQAASVVAAARFQAGAGAGGTTPFAFHDLRHSFASLLLHEGRREHYVARQLGHDARLTVTTYGHVIDEFEESPTLGAEDAIAAARESICARFVRAAPSGGTE
jgi:site-specific recombinase XerC